MASLIMGPVLEAEVKRVREFAEKSENWYRADAKVPNPPGADPRYVFFSGTVKAVFSWTTGRNQVFRHVSISTSSGKMPHPMIAFTLAHMLGFTGASPDSNGIVKEAPIDWIIGKNPEEPAIAVLQQL